jgi:hypothetical protein
MKALKHLSFSLFLIPTILSANLGERVGVEIRPISQEVADELEVAKRKEFLESEEGALQEAGFIYDQYPSVYHSTSSHWLSAVKVIDYNYYSLELEDGSIWKIHSYDGIKALNWRINDPVTITQNNRWFSKHNYRVINKITGSSIEATLLLGPVQLGEYSRYIISVNPVRREVLLSDNSTWEISSLDGYLLKDWAPNDYVIIGTNSNYSLWDSGSDVILINVNMNSVARAKQF